MVSIKRIRISSLRGTPYTSIDLNGKGLFLVGRNASGKSTMVDALEYFFRGKVEHVRDFHMDAAPVGDRFLSHADHDISESKVEIAFDIGGGNVETVTRSRGMNPVANNPSLSNYVSEGSNALFILRRAQVLGFVNAAPLQRYTQLGALMGIDNLHEIQVQFDRCVGSLQEAGNKMQSDLDAKRGILTSQFGSEEKAEVLKCLNQEAEQVGIVPQNSLDSLASAIQHWIESLSDSATIENASSELDSSIESMKRASKLLSRLDDLQRHRVSTIDTLRIQILRLGKGWLAREKEDICPLCNQPVQCTDLTQDIDKRLAAAQQDQAHIDDVESQKRSLLESLSIGANNMDRAQSKIIGITALKGQAQELNRIRLGMESVYKGKDTDSLDLKTIDTNLRNMQTKVESVKDRIRKALPSDKDKKVKAIWERACTARDLFTEIQDLVQDSIKLQGAVRCAQIVREFYQEESVQYVNRQYQNISGLVEQYYDFIHPNEPHTNLSVTLTGNRNKTELKIHSFGKGLVDPRGYGSEGHLDSLGIALFLAFVKTYYSQCSLVVLDDVFTTIDAEHRERIIELLIQEFFDERQLIITTHDEGWTRQFSEKLKAHRLENMFEQKSITEWTLAGGPIIRPLLTDWAEVRFHMSQGHYPAAANRTRSNLQWLIETACEKMQVQVSYRRKKSHRLGDLFNALRKQLESRLQYNTNTDADEIRKAFLDTDSNTVWGNLLSHPLDPSMNIGQAEVTLLIRDVKELERVLSCRTCNRLLEKRGSSLRCISCHQNPTAIQTT